MLTAVYRRKFDGGENHPKHPMVRPGSCGQRGKEDVLYSLVNGSTENAPRLEERGSRSQTRLLALRVRKSMFTQNFIGTGREVNKYL